ncbi:MAG TPA: T9SS type A sorting domain-containing protein [Ignavibacteriaceae bacterium]|nr:T9SS type A sorting domain-containing protein [Ignavibacteriaceae bacterium]
MKYIICFLSIFFFSSISNSQITQPIHFQNQNNETSNKESFLLGLQDSSLLMVWFARDTTELGKLYSAKSTDNGHTWGNTNLIMEFSENLPVDINLIYVNSGRILLTFKNSTYKILYSDDNGVNWLGYSELPTFNNPISKRRAVCTSLSRANDGSAIFVFSYNTDTNSDSVINKRIYHIRSYDNGISWSANQIIDTSGVNGNIVSLGSSKEMLVYETTNTSVKNIIYCTSTNNGVTWSNPQVLLSNDYNKYKPRVIKDQTNKFWLLFYRNDPTLFSNFYQSEIYYSTSTDEGVSWTEPVKFTNYSGEDNLLSLSTWNGMPLASFTTTRDYSIEKPFYQLYYGIPGVTEDNSTPPFLFDYSTIPEYPAAAEPITIRAFADDENELAGAQIQLTINDTSVLIDMYDDGLHGDSLAGDNIYGYVLAEGVTGNILNYDFILRDVDNNSAGFRGSTLPDFTLKANYLLDVNNLKLPINRKGILGSVQIDSIVGLIFEESSVLYSGGFMLSGYNQNQLWANGVLSASLVEDYLAGPVGIPPNDPRNSIYVVKATDPPFGQSWLNYAYAVNFGADFYDGDGDGKYNPVDLNGNGQWDLNEDCPDILGDITAWCVYNDGLPGANRRWNQVSPMGIEIHQTLFAIGNVSNPVDNMIFIRYRVRNTGTISSRFDSVYFGIWSDPDIGYCFDDLAGSDSLLDLSYSYNNGEDLYYGYNPPALGTKYLSGPVAFISGETFVDINGNGIYDDGIDTPLDTAIVSRGEIMGLKIFPGAKNLPMSSFVRIVPGDPFLRDPDNREQARNYMLGKLIDGSEADPCTFTQGSVQGGVDCNTINPSVWFSGDPVTNYGWINTSPEDQRTITSTGPFTLSANEDMDIWIAYIVGRGNSALESVTKLKQYSSAASFFYKSNFTELPTSVWESQLQIPENFILFQNYPNPFNPVTTIKYDLPVKSNVSLTVYDIIGRKIKELVNTKQAAGKYELRFDASNLASGVYIYKLQAADFMSSKKMLLLK